MIYNPSEKGQGLVEYALILALVAIVVIVILGALGNSVNQALSTVNSALP
jgi:pilus assembly protein Flp/PilA